MNKSPEHPPLVGVGSEYARWIGVSCTAFSLATAYAIAVVVLRIPGIGIGTPTAFRVALAMHVEFAVYFWLMSSMAGQWVAPRASSSANRGITYLALAGTLLLAAAPLAGGQPVMADYFPWLGGNGVFFAGFALFSAAVAAAAFMMVVRRLWGKGDNSVDDNSLTAVPVLAALATLLGDVANGATDPVTLAWGGGHILLFAHVGMMLWEWGQLTGVGRRAARWSAYFFSLITISLAATPWFFDPGSLEHRSIFTLAMTWLLWPPAALMWFLLIGHYTSARSAPPLGPMIAVGLFPLGLLLGAAIDSQTTLVTAHYHAAIGAVAISRMAMTYASGVTLRGGGPVRPSRRRGQLVTYGIGLILLISGLAIASLEGAPRKTSASESVVHGPAYRVGMAISGIGGLFAMVGSAWLVGNLIGRRQHQSIQERPEKRTRKCQARATTARSAAASSQEVVQS